MTESPGEHHWVLAAPFRAHVVQLQAGSGLPLSVLARAAGVSPTLVRHLVVGRNGRRPRRIDPESAIRLLALDRSTLACLALEWVPARRTGLQLRQLLVDGVDPDRLAAWCRLSRSQLLALAGSPQCTRLVALLVDAACPPHLAADGDPSPAAA